MSPSFRGKSTKIKYVGDLRKSKITNVAGCGALVEFSGFSGIMGGQNLWNTNFKEDMIIHEHNLEKLLGKEFFVQVTSNTNYLSGRKEYSIPVLRFPNYYYCPNCYELDYASKLGKNYKSDKDYISPLKCNNCGTELLASRFVIACEDGHIDDFPYVWWVHRKKGKSCENPRLKIKYTGITGGLESILVSCESCGASNNMNSCLNVEALSHLKCLGKRPWLGERNSCECGKNVRTLMRGASNVYYAQTKEVLTIPPWSSGVQREINKNYNVYKQVYDIGEESIFETFVRKTFQKKNYENLYKCSEEEYVNQVNMRFNKADEEEIKLIDIKYDEYKALIGPDKDDAYFKTQEEQLDIMISQYFSKIKLVKRLREVQVLDSFKRISAEMNVGFPAPISTKKENWLPAVEMLGEGIFIEFNKERVLKWKSINSDRYVKMQKRYNSKKMYLHRGSFSPIYVLIHTFSHLLIKELSFVCGYDSSALKEKIYFEEDDDKWMCGLLIYTATSSSDGSLGGLVRQGETKRLKKIVEALLDKAKWCSNDPICIETEAQGKNSLNYAACHACALISEISCEMNNELLDRYAIIGNMNIGKKGFFE